LISALRNDVQARVVDIDGWTALNAYIPPKERRGLVLIDPAFEQPDEFERMTKALTAALAKWPGGIYAAWYPVKDRRGADVFAHKIAALTDKCLRVEWTVAPPERDDRTSRHVNPPLAAAGLLIVNPPWTLEADLKTLMPSVMAALSPVGGHWLVDQPKS
jgi:23S rRNA (adenine2030-N6)-methyltransferase